MSRSPRINIYCKSTLAFFEWIAAFDCVEAAYAYANDCARASPRFQYRVTKGAKLMREFNGAQLPKATVAKLDRLVVRRCDLSGAELRTLDEVVEALEALGESDLLDRMRTLNARMQGRAL